LVSAIPNQPEPGNPYYSQRDNSTKTGDPQFFVLTDPAATVEEMENAIWQNIGGHEIISLARRDLVDGINLDYNLINNLKSLQEEYNPQTIFPIEDIITKYFERFGLKFQDFVPDPESLSRIDDGIDSPVILDDNGDIVIYVKNIKDNQEVEIQILGSQELLRDTIY
jgi:hypothetical protein